mmetsp:Transcript_8275/g.24852  ORF Transcript_8275/g.24852 Transcript_8275/m.24852 type:complete len:101 (+) Transcript_8275:462-764(+)
MVSTTMSDDFGWLVNIRIGRPPVVDSTCCTMGHPMTYFWLASLLWPVFHQELERRTHITLLAWYIYDCRAPPPRISHLKEVVPSSSLRFACCEPSSPKGK